MSNSLFKSKKFILFTAITTLLVIIISTFIYLNNQAFNEKKIQKLIENEFLGKITKISDFTNLDYYNKQKPELLLTKYDFTKPIYSIWLNDCIYTVVPKPDLKKEDCTSFTVIIGYLERTSLTDWKVVDFKRTSILKTTYDKAKNTIQKHDLSTLPNKFEDQEIRRGSYLTPEEIESNRKLKERNNKTDIIFKKYTDIYFTAEKQGNAAKKKAILEEIIPGLKDILTQLNEGKTVQGTNGDITPDKESKDLIQVSISEFEKEVITL